MKTGLTHFLTDTVIQRKMICIKKTAQNLHKLVENLLKVMESHPCRQHQFASRIIHGYLQNCRMWLVSEV